jgi:3-hydroxyacyl-CoA dehydrogenase
MATIKTIAVIGAGAMGRGIAHAAALAGLPASLRKAGDEFRGALDEAVTAGRLSPEQVHAAGMECS